MADDIEIRFAGDLQRLELRPGDRFVMTYDRALSAQEHAHLQSVWKRFAGDGHPLLILDSGLKLGAVAVA